MNQVTTKKRRRTQDRIALLLSIPLAALLIVCSGTGLLHPGIYAAETPNWLAQTVGQDIMDLFLITPLLLVSAFYTYSGNRLARIVWGGTIAYLIYTFLIYCFCVNFNPLFALYCTILGLCFFSFIFFIKGAGRERIHVSSQGFITVAGWYFILIAILFSTLWLMEIIPASIAGNTPRSVTIAGLPTNPVHVIDLSMVLPSIFLLGLMLLKKEVLGFYLTPVVLTFFILMDLTIAALTAIMMQRGESGDVSVMVVMCILALFSLALLIWFLRSSVEDLSH